MLRTLCLFACCLAFAAEATAQTRQVYFGMLHSHTSLSDGSGTPAEAYDSAKSAGLHFFALTEHNHPEAAGSDGIFLTPANYRDLIAIADSKTVDGQFVAIYGQEVSTISTGNHENVFFAPEIVDMPNGNFRYLYETWLPNHPDASFVQLNHPSRNGRTKKDYGYDDYNQSFPDLLAACDRYVALIEVIKGTTESTATNSPHRDGQNEDDYLFYLNQGFHVAPSVGGDEHKKTWGRTMKARLGVWATELSRGGLEEAIRGRHCYATEDDSIQVQLSVGQAIMGSQVELTGSQSVQVTVRFHDPGEPTAMHRVQLFYDNAVGDSVAQVVENQLVAAGIAELTLPVTVQPGGYLFAKVVQITQEGNATHADDTWTAPLWFTQTGQELFAGGGPAPTPPTTPVPAVIDWSDARSYVGATVTVKGKVVRVHNHEDRILFINFSPDFRNTLSLVVYADDFEDFDPFEGVDALDTRLVGKVVEVKGKITLYQNSRPQMVLRTPDQILSVSDQ